METYSRLVLVILLWWQSLAITDNFGFCHGNPNASCWGDEREALLSFKQGLRDPSNWLSSWVGEDCCSWPGVHCHNITRHVIRLSLRKPPSIVPTFSMYGVPAVVYEGTELSGNISRSLTQLKQLQFLDLSQNNFGGVQIPEFFGSLTNLRYLNLTSARFGGAIPPQLGNLSSLRCLALGNNWHMNANKGLEWISHLSMLKVLDFSSIDLRKVSNWLQIMNMLQSLSELYLSSCLLNRLTPLSHANFSLLLVLDLSVNSLNHSDFSRLISSLPSQVLSLDLSSNNINGPIPNSLRNMTSLRSLNLAFIGMNSTVPEWLYDHTSLRTLHLSSNKFQGTISEAIGNLTSLVELCLSFNDLVGEIPRSIKNLCNLRVLDLTNNKLVGSVPEYIGSLSSCAKERLEELFMQGNRVSGHLPNQLGNFRRLFFISISSCGLNGTIPESHGNLSEFVELDISNNSLVGTVSDVHFTNLTRLQVLNVSANSYLNFQFNSD